MDSQAPGGAAVRDRGGGRFLSLVPGRREQGVRGGPRYPSTAQGVRLGCRLHSASTPRRTLSPHQPVLTKLRCAWAGWGNGAGLGQPLAAEGAGTAGLGGHLGWGSGLGCGRGHWAGGTWRQTGLAEALAGPWPMVITGRAGLASGILGRPRASMTPGRTEAQRAGGPGRASVETGAP